GLSADGTRVVFVSWAGDLVANDVNHCDDAFVRDFTTGTTLLASVGASGAAGDFGVWFAALSGDGNVVAFTTLADNVVPTDLNAFSDCFVRDLAAGTTALMSCN